MAKHKFIRYINVYPEMETLGRLIDPDNESGWEDNMGEAWQEIEIDGHICTAHFGTWSWVVWKEGVGDIGSGYSLKEAVDKAAEQLRREGPVYRCACPECGELIGETTPVHRAERWQTCQKLIAYHMMDTHWHNGKKGLEKLFRKTLWLMHEKSTPDIQIVPYFHVFTDSTDTAFHIGDIEKAVKQFREFVKEMGRARMYLVIDRITDQVQEDFYEDCLIAAGDFPT